ncbi:esterase [Oryctes borbonicus]|uniref:Esterase n=1 Tax=Oryctes borbonicus TaxID=1629725 RepID=A0A0T6B3X6_9SCAR|nr:esterase [Oryctes borbonicus]
MLAITSLVLFVVTALANPYPNPDPVSKTTSQHSVHVPTVTTTLGDAKGTIITSRQGKSIYSYKGLRYAKAPVKELRFQAPAPAEKWDNVFNATIDAAACPQPNVEETSEDCLFLNVYTTKVPKGNDNPNRPVIVYFHQGEFHSSSGRSVDIGPQYLLDQEIVLVTPNYRLGALGKILSIFYNFHVKVFKIFFVGFLSTGDKEAPGNYGLKDQVQALKWVKDNIAAFGGNPDSVTIAGYCAGAASVTLHLVSPLSKGLFNKAIVMSGSVYGNWPLGTDQLDLAKRQAKLLGCTDETSVGIVKCLRDKSAEEIANSLPNLKEFGNEPVVHWSPVIEQDFGQSRFLLAHPVETVLREKVEKVPILVGITADEFGGRAFDIIANDTLLNDLDKEFEKYGPIVFVYERDTDNSKAISKSLKSSYFGEKSIDKSSLPALAQLYSDSLVGFNVNRFVEVMAQKNEHVFYYNFNYKGRYSFFYLPDSNNTSPYGASHLDDLIYLFYIPKFPLFKESGAESSMIEKMTTMWFNFVAHSVPIKEPCELLDNVKWNPYTSTTQSYMDIGNKLVLNEKLLEKRYERWRKLYPLSKYGASNIG